MKRVGLRLLSLFSSLRLAVMLMLGLLLLTYLGTLHQIDHGLLAAKRTYFSSWLVLEPIGPLVLPLPGAYPLMLLLFVNLLVGGIARVRWRVANSGVLIIHLGIAYLLFTGFVQFHWADEGFIKLYEHGDRERLPAGEGFASSRDHFLSHYDWEIVVIEPLEDGRYREHIVPASGLHGVHAPAAVELRFPDLPFALAVGPYFVNSKPMAKGPQFDVPLPVIDGYFIAPMQRDPQAERNWPGCYVELRPGPELGELRTVDGGQRGLLWGGSFGGAYSQKVPPLTLIDDDGRQWGVKLRQQRYPLPFALRLEDFRASYYPGTNTPRSYESDVTVLAGGVSEKSTIKMNEPLRRDNVIAFQSGFGPPDAPPEAPHYSIFTVVRNVADQWPLYACIVISLGLVLHFGRVLIGYIRAESGARP